MEEDWDNNLIDQIADRLGIEPEEVTGEMIQEEIEYLDRKYEDELSEPED